MGNLINLLLFIIYLIYLFNLSNVIYVNKRIIWLYTIWEITEQNNHTV